MKKKIAIFGSTGSIGVNTLEVVKNLHDLFEVTSLSTNTNIGLLLKQINDFKPKVVAVASAEKAKELRAIPGLVCEVLSGSEGIEQIATEADYDIFVGAMVGFAGLSPTIAAVKRGKRIALANKETLVVAGELVTLLCAQFGAELIPVDSEHSAIFQCLVGEQKSEIDRLIITASGGPFFFRSQEELSNVSLEEALKHPTWQMGAKITIDSASMMNKGLEVIEARWLFNILPNKIDVVVHPQSIIHSMVEFSDGSIKAQLSLPDMKLPIQYALTYPARVSAVFKPLRLEELKNLTFFEPDLDRFGCLKIAYEVLKEGGTAPCIANAANEIAVAKFLRSEIKFLRIPEIIKKSLDKMENYAHPSIEQLYECDIKTRTYSETLN